MTTPEAPKPTPDMVCGVLNGQWWSRPASTTGVPSPQFFKQWRAVSYVAGPNKGDWTALMEANHDR